jgi:hypothetical protein
MQNQARQYTPPAEDYQLSSSATEAVGQDVIGMMGDLTLAPSASSSSREKGKENQERSSSRSTGEGREKKQKESREKEKATKSSAPLVVDGSCGRGKRCR